MAVKVRHALSGIDIHKELVVSGLTKYVGLQDELPLSMYHQLQTCSMDQICSSTLHGVDSKNLEIIENVQQFAYIVRRLEWIFFHIFEHCYRPPKCTFIFIPYIRDESVLEYSFTLQQFRLSHTITIQNKKKSRMKHTFLYRSCTLTTSI